MTIQQVSHYLRVSEHHVLRTLRKNNIPYRTEHKMFDGNHDRVIPAYISPWDIEIHLRKMNPGQTFNVCEKYE